ncbi:MAG: NADH-quinone oxidoreductase subunit J [Planctomycetes bacterium]|nr:NADH-quinone oxidoreductase subunit J [Planctomycetota bacterium]
MPDLQKPFYALLTVFLLGMLGWGMSSAGAEGLAFGFFAALTLGGSLMCIWERSVVRSAFALMATFGGAAGLYVLLGADFVGMAQVLIYVGGILALLLFGVMLSPPDLEERKLPRVFGGLGLMGIAVAWVAAKVSATVEWAALPADQLPEPKTSVDQIGVGFIAPDQYVVAFELAAVVLTVALVAAVYIARRKMSDFGESQENA